MGVPMIGKLLGHSQPQTPARYAHLDHDPVTAANEAIGRRIAAAIAGQQPAKVVKLRQRYLRVRDDDYRFAYPASKRVRGRESADGG